MWEINDTLLLSPYSHSNDSNISKKDDILIKESLFEFLSCVERRMTYLDLSYTKMLLYLFVDILPGLNTQ